MNVNAPKLKTGRFWLKRAGGERLRTTDNNIVRIDLVVDRDNNVSFEVTDYQGNVTSYHDVVACGR